MTWRKSSFSSNGSACVEVAWSEQAVAVRDSKGAVSGNGRSYTRSHSRHLVFPDGQWRSFLRTVS